MLFLLPRRRSHLSTHHLTKGAPTTLFSSLPPCEGEIAKSGGRVEDISISYGIGGVLPEYRTTQLCILLKYSGERGGVGSGLGNDWCGPS